MSSIMSARIEEHFVDLTDSRRREVTYPLINVVTIALCAVICGADDFVSIAAWGHMKRGWLAKLLDLSSGIPSHDRFNAILAAIKPAEFEKCLLSWITALHEITAGQLVDSPRTPSKPAITGSMSCSAAMAMPSWRRRLKRQTPK